MPRKGRKGVRNDWRKDRWAWNKRGRKEEREERSKGGKKREQEQGT